MTTFPFVPRGGVIPEWTLADRLAKSRSLAGMEQADIARLLEVSPASVSKWERGYNVRPIFVRAWATYTGVDFEWLRSGRAESETDPPGALRGRDSNSQPSGAPSVYVPVLVSALAA